MKNLLNVFVAALVVFSTAAYAATSIWNATDRAPAESTYRIPIDTSSSSGPGYIDVGDISTYILGRSTGITLPLSVSNGGTGGTTTPGNGTILIGNGTTYAASTLTAGSGITITNGAGSIQIDATSVTSGDVVGPASATDNAIARFDSTTGKLIQNSGASIDDSGNITATNLSGTNTGDQTITLTGDVTGAGTGSFATTIGPSKVTNTMLAGSIAASKLVGTDIATVGTITSGVWTGSTIATTRGGTNINTYTTGDILYASASNTLSKLAVGSNGQVLTLAAGIPSWATVSSGSGDVVGPASATDNALARFDSTTGKLIQNSVGILDDSGNLSGLGTVASGAHTITSASANSLAVGPNGTTNPALQVDSSTASSATGYKIVSAAAAGGAALNIISSGTNESGTITCAKGTGSCIVGTPGSGTIGLKINGTTRYFISATGILHSWSTQSGGSSSTAGHYTFTGVSDSAMTAGTDSAIMLMDYGQNRQHASNTTVANDRALWIKAPSFAFATAGGTVTSACTLCVDAAPTAGTNATITASYAIKAETGNVYFDGKIVHGATNTAGGTTGDQTINKATGTVNFAAAATSLTVTNNLVTTSSLVFAVVRTNDTTALIKNVVPGSGSFVINLNAAATAETSVGFMVIN